MKRTATRIVAAALAAPLLIFSPAFADDGPVETVKAFYLHPDADERDPARYTGAALDTFDKNAKYEEKTGDVGCLDFSIPFNAQDWDQTEVEGTLKVSLDSQDGDGATVKVTFSNFGRDEDILWTLKQVDGKWLVADVSYAGGQWKLSTMCEDL